MAKHENLPTPNEIFTELGQSIREHREKRRLSQTALAREMGITQGALSEIEAGRRRVTIPKLVEFCHVLGCRPNALLHW